MSGFAKFHIGLRLRVWNGEDDEQSDALERRGQGAACGDDGLNALMKALDFCRDALNDQRCEVDD